MTADEQQEYVRCALDVHYFVEKYCKVKREDGSIGSIALIIQIVDRADVYGQRKQFESFRTILEELWNSFSNG